MSNQQLIFVYNADSGIFNTATDIAHKLISPKTYQCDLCSLTHGVFKIRKNWVSFLQTINIETEFLHRDEFLKKYGQKGTPLPAIFTNNDSIIEVWLSANEINQCETLDKLKAKIELKLHQDMH